MSDVMATESGTVKEPEKKRRIKLYLPHPAFQCPKVKKHRYRRWLLLSILIIPCAHFMTPEWEYAVTAFNGLVFYFEPVLEEAEMDI